MKLIIDGYEVNISVKRTTDKRCSLLETMYFLNKCCIAFDEAAKRIEGNMPATSKRYEKISNDIYVALKAAGAYKEV